MIYIKPNYFDDFKCIADKCKHSCCIGWEIDIDSDTEMFYSVLPGETGEKIRNNISSDNPPHFILNNNKCPFLNEKGLCDIILKLGEDSVCEICREHPRFYNRYENFTEAGLGLCCEEVSNIILNSDSFSIIGKAEKLNKEEVVFLEKRDKIFNILQDKTVGILNRFEKLALEFGFNFSDFSEEKVKRNFYSLERLDENWSIALVSEVQSVPIEDISFYLEQFACYLIYRHFKRVMQNKEYAKCIKFVLSACFLLWKMCSKKSDFENLARMFSCEVEYSEKNMLAIFEKM